jgi:hypothetical protein
LPHCALNNAKQQKLKYDANSGGFARNEFRCGVCPIPIQ